MRAAGAAMIAVLAALGPLPAAAGCRLALALAFDVSRSVSDADYEIQRQGMIAALRDPGVRRGFLASDDLVALTIYEWSGARDQEVVQPWMMIRSEDDLAAVERLLAARVRVNFQLPTGLGAALRFGRSLMDEAPACDAQTIDVSGDGRSNDGTSPARAYARSDFSAITVNGLAIGGHEADIADYYRTEVIRGPGAFVETAPEQADFPRAIRRKLLRELTAQMLSDARAPAPPAGLP